MPFLDTKQQRASALIALLGVGLFMALWPFTTGLIGAPVLYVLFAPEHRWLARRMNPQVAAGLILALAFLVIVLPSIALVGLVVAQAQDLASGVVQSPLLARLRELKIGPYDIGPQLEALSTRAVSLAGEWVLAGVGTATRVALQLTLAFFGLYYLLTGPGKAWARLEPFIPFSRKNAEALRDRFQNVTRSTVIGTGLTALLQGIGVAIAFAVTGLPNAVVWGVITVVLSVLPIVGSGLVWIPGVAVLAADRRYGAAVALAIWGLVVIGQVDNVVRPIVYRRWAKIHPFITLLGAIAGLRWFGLLGLLIGPLALSYFFELIRMYRQEYLANGADTEPQP
ncbi:MAG TPA: AI-2E family transporter [Gemmatimonadales bacterium]|nr:AI-2E family transporter [Gemmatimonadales bacterium]